jgi:hypothetical protein
MQLLLLLLLLKQQLPNDDYSLPTMLLLSTVSLPPFPPFLGPFLV